MPLRICLNIESRIQNQRESVIDRGGGGLTSTGEKAVESPKRCDAPRRPDAKHCEHQDRAYEACEDEHVRYPDAFREEPRDNASDEGGSV